MIYALKIRAKNQKNSLLFLEVGPCIFSRDFENCTGKLIIFMAFYKHDIFDRGFKQHYQSTLAFARDLQKFQQAIFVNRVQKYF